MSWQGWYTLTVIGIVFVMMVRGMGPPDILLLGGSVLVALAGIITPEDLATGFSNKSMLTIGALFVVAAAMRETGALDRIGAHMLGRVRTERGALLRIAPQVAGLSAFLNNTAVVAMMIPILTDWCRKFRISPSRLLLPLAYLAILGGMCTLVGTSRNLIVSELMEEAAAAPQTSALGQQSLRNGFTMFELAWIGVPSLVCGAAYLLVAGRWLLPDRKDLLEQLGESAREYLVDIRIQSNCPLIGQTVQEAGLRRLPGLFLIEIVRGERVVAPVAPDEILQADDQLTFTGVVSTIVDLERIPGFVPVTDEHHEIGAAARRARRYCEAVISRTSPLIGQNIRAANFRARYNAAIVAVHRGREHLKGRIGDFVLQAGDTLLLQAGWHFADANRNNPDFFLVSRITAARPVRHERASLALGLLGALIVLMILPQVPIVLAAFTIGGLMIALRCISAGDARRSVQWDVLLTIAAAFGLGRALDKSGAAEVIGSLGVSLIDQFGTHAVLAAVYVTTVVFGILISSNATAVLMFPIAMAVSEQLGVDPRPFAVTVAVAASVSFASPIAYQTNMLVYGPGGYRFTDFMRIGIPLNVLLAIVALLVIPQVWPFQ
ncbi:MAG: SLC13 family permease [Planctomycetes bacterium]|nr:SLC13 family permease [Planctomycetota bacterium]